MAAHLGTRRNKLQMLEDVLIERMLTGLTGLDELDGLDGLDRLDGLDGLDALYGLYGLYGLDGKKLENGISDSLSKSLTDQANL